MAAKTRDLTEKQRNRLIIQSRADEAVLHKQAIERAREKVMAILKREKVTLGEIAPSLVPSDSRPALPPKYQHPTDPALTWTGQGRPPAWYTELTRNGVDRAKLLVSSYASKDVVHAVTQAKAKAKTAAKKAAPKRAPATAKKKPRP